MGLECWVAGKETWPGPRRMVSTEHEPTAGRRKVGSQRGDCLEEAPSTESCGGADGARQHCAKGAQGTHRGQGPRPCASGPSLTTSGPSLGSQNALHWPRPAVPAEA